MFKGVDENGLLDIDNMECHPPGNFTELWTLNEIRTLW